MQFYRYFKGHEKAGVWRPFPIDREENQFANPMYGFCTVLAVNEAAGRREAISDAALYTGPFYIDIDSDDIKKSIKAAKKVLDRLRSYGIRNDQMNLWASGKRGFHFTIPMSLFCSDTALPRLALVYLNLARGMKIFDIEEVDKSVYSSGRGRMWRIPNVKRADNGKFKVSITFAELESMTEVIYAELCNAPRDVITVVTTTEKNDNLQALYNLALARAGEMKKPKSTLIDQNLKDELGEEGVPPCVRCLVEGRNFKPDTGFNARSLQMNKALRAFVPTTAQEALIDEFVEKNEGETHNTPESRREHLNRSRGSVQDGSDYAWSCRSMLSIMDVQPCSLCPIAHIKHEQDEQAEAEEPVSLRAVAQELIAQNEGARPVESAEPEYVEDKPESPVALAKLHAVGRPEEPLDSEEGLTFNDKGYGFAAGDGAFRRVSNFVLRFTKVYYEYIPNLQQDRRVSTYAEVFVGTRKVGGVMIEEAAWLSKNGFAAIFQGLANCAFYGTDNDVAKMKITLMARIDEEADKIRRVTSCGIHHLRIGEAEVFTYVEPGYSIDNYGNVDTYQLSGQAQAAPKLRTIQPLPITGDELTTNLLRNLFKINSPENVARILGWMMACFMKQHIMSYRNEFPLLCIWGKAGAGKTATSGIFSSLHGTAYLGGSGSDGMESPLSLGGEASSNFALWNFISSSMTVPRVIEEYNKKNLGKKYEIFSEYFKEVWNQHSVKRGTIRNQKHHGDGAIGASTIDIAMTGPCLVISEQSIEVPALKHRTVEVQLYDQQRMAPEVRKAWGSISPRWRSLNRFAKTAYMEAIQVPVSQVQDWIAEYEDKIPTAIGERPYFSFCVLGMGLNFLGFLDKKYNLGLTRDVNKLKDDLVEYAAVNASDLSIEKTRTEVDLVMEQISNMIELSKSERMTQWLTKDHYRRIGNELLLDGIVAHAQYVRYMVGQHKSIAIDAYNQFKQLIRSEDYCDSSEYQTPEFARGRKVLKINLNRLAHRGIDVNVFEE